MSNLIQMARSMGKKGQAGVIGGFAGSVIGFVVLVFVLVVGGLLIQGVLDTQTASTAGANISTYGLRGLLNIGAQLPLVGTALVLGLLITVIVVAVGAFVFRGRMGG